MKTIPKGLALLSVALVMITVQGSTPQPSEVDVSPESVEIGAIEVVGAPGHRHGLVRHRELRDAGLWQDPTTAG